MASVIASRQATREPKKTDPSQRLFTRDARSSLKSSATLPTGSENACSTSSTRTAWTGRSSPTAGRATRPSTAVGPKTKSLNFGSSLSTACPSSNSAPFRDITNVAPSRIATKTLKHAQSARTLPAPVPVPTRAPAVTQPPPASKVRILESLHISAADEEPHEVHSCRDYVPEIYDLLFAQEDLSIPFCAEIFRRGVEASIHRQSRKCTPIHNYFDAQPDINCKMRAILIDWLVEVHTKYKLRPPTLFLAVNLIDRYLSKGVTVSRKKLQLVGVVAMLIASKFEEIEPPTVDEFVYITDNAYTRNEVLSAECTMLAELGFEIVVPTAWHFLSRFVRVYPMDIRGKALARYLLELALIDVKTMHYMPSELAAAAVLQSNSLLGENDPWPTTLASAARHSKVSLQPCCDDLQDLLKKAGTSNLQAVRKKFQLKEFQSVADLFIEAIPT